MTADQLKRKDTPAERCGDGAALLDEERPPAGWSAGTSLRLAGYEDDPSETHIVRGID